MKLFDVYPLFDITPVKAQGTWLWDEQGKKFLDLYGGHAVISIGHSHPYYVKRLTDQLQKIAFYSNSIRNPLQEELAEKWVRFQGIPTISCSSAIPGQRQTKMHLSLLHLLLVGTRSLLSGSPSTAVLPVQWRQLTIPR